MSNDELKNALLSAAPVRIGGEERAMTLDRNGYAPSIMQDDTSFCYACGKRAGKLDRHEPFGGANRGKRKALGLWIVLRHTPCHQGRTGAHADPAVNEEYRKEAQRRAMEVYGWTTADFIRAFGKNHL